MTDMEGELQRERIEHQIVADALASVRLFHTLYGHGEQAREWIAELSRRLLRMGCEKPAADGASILATTADAIAKAYLGRSAQELEWPEAGR
ncbi:hypothetical protein [Azospirillum sp.]|uniref:hypothetical protein n=1 Tax=Azospirillum sp. TaxID=34012 RepID=UPI003D70365A